jgi:hypothetical protein
MAAPSRAMIRWRIRVPPPQEDKGSCRRVIPGAASRNYDQDMRRRGIAIDAGLA